jgi:hypothetical protein
MFHIELLVYARVKHLGEGCPFHARSWPRTSKCLSPQGFYELWARLVSPMEMDIYSKFTNIVAMMESSPSTYLTICVYSYVHYIIYTYIDIHLYIYTGVYIQYIYI